MTDTPTMAQVAEATAVLAQYRAAIVNEQRAKIQPVADLFDNHDITKMIDDLETMDPVVRYDPQVAPHLTAVLIGLQGLRNIVGSEGTEAAMTLSPGMTLVSDQSIPG